VLVQDKKHGGSAAEEGRWHCTAVQWYARDQHKPRVLMCPQACLSAVARWRQHTVAVGTPAVTEASQHLGHVPVHTGVPNSTYERVANEDGYVGSGVG
jgi:hypothetical protein